MELENTLKRLVTQAVSRFSTDLFKSWKKNSPLAFSDATNGLVLPHLGYVDTVWGHQPGVKTEMD